MQVLALRLPRDKNSLSMQDCERMRFPWQFESLVHRNRSMTNKVHTKRTTKFALLQFKIELNRAWHVFDEDEC